LPLRVEQPHQELRFANNLFWREGGPVQLAWGDRVYSSLEAWRGETRQEIEGQTPTGLFANPFLKATEMNFTAGRGKDWHRPFQPLPTSPAAAGGVNLGEIGLKPGCCDLAGTLLPSKGPFFLGALGVRKAGE
jgi:hypothetical protein